MKFCEHCGTQVLDEAVVCSKCGCNVAAATPVNATQAQTHKFCNHCGNQVLREAVMCPQCKQDLSIHGAAANGKILQVLAKVFMVMGIVACIVISIFFLVAATTLNEVGLADSFLSSSINLTLLTRIYFICSVLALLPLFYLIPMTVYYFKATKNKRPVGMAFKVCTLLFVNMIAGILMICDNTENK